MKYLHKEAELKRIKKMKELEMAKAEMDAMKALEDDENFSPAKQSETSCQRFQERSGLNLDPTPFVPKEFATPLKSELLHLPTLEVSTPRNPFRMPPLELPLMPVNPEAEVKVPPDPCKPFPSELPCFPVKVEHQSLGSRNPFTPPSFKSEQERQSPGSSKVTFQEIVKLQTRQTELSALIAEQQQISSLPVQEPPTFSGSHFDYPIFMRAFETIIKFSWIS